MGGQPVSMPIVYCEHMKKSTAYARSAAKASRSSASAKGKTSLVREGFHTGRQIERIQQIHVVLAEGRAVNVATLLKRLGESASAAKTIRRDLAFMRDRMCYPVSEYDAVAGGFYYTETVTNLPMIQITEGEVLSLLVARQAMDAYRGTPYARLLARAFDKLRAGLRDVVSFPGSGLSDAISFRTTGAGVMDEALFIAVSKAVLDRCEATFTYKKAGEDEAAYRRVRPYHLASIGGLWYLAAYDLDREAMRTFALPRIRDFRATETTFVRERNFSPETYFGDGFGVVRGEERVTVRIEFDAYAGALVRERHWHESQKITEKPDGGIELELQVSHTDEVRRWVLGWGEGARVIGPPALVAEMREVVELLAAAYRRE
jgi:predicted DNA-binding transcriptional regulator YafY